MAATEAPARLVVLAPNWLGDALMALPAIASVRRWLSDAQLTVAARRAVAPVFSRVDGVDAVVTLDGRGGWRDVMALGGDARRLRDGGFDAALLLPNSFHAALLAKRAGIVERWGYRRDARRWLLTRAIAPPRMPLHHAAYYLHLVQALGGTAAPLVARLRITDDDRRRAQALLQQHGWDGGRLVGVAPGAAFGLAKRWPPDRMGRTIAALAGTHAVTPVLVGTRADRSTVAEVTSAYRRERGVTAPFIDLAGETDLHTLAAVLASCAVVLSNDSGAMHVAAATGTPIVAVFGPTNERRTAPLAAGPERRASMVAGRAWCRPCELRACPIDHRCMTSVHEGEVIAAAETYLTMHAGEGVE
jgi:heptosyltransferase-2